MYPENRLGSLFPSNRTKSECDTGVLESPSRLSWTVRKNPVGLTDHETEIGSKRANKTGQATTENNLDRQRVIVIIGDYGERVANDNNGGEIVWLWRSQEKTEKKNHNNSRV